MAQLGARFHGMEEVTGSIPVRSTKIPSNSVFFGPALLFLESDRFGQVQNFQDLSGQQVFEDLGAGVRIVLRQGVGITYPSGRVVTQTRRR